MAGRNETRLGMFELAGRQDRMSASENLFGIREIQPAPLQSDLSLSSRHLMYPQ
jgi:hypothetical protein